MCHRHTRDASSEAETTDEQPVDAPDESPAGGIGRTPVSAVKRVVAAVWA